MDKGGTKSGGFFNLFDWNRKSRKKLFSSGSVSPENTKNEKRSQDNLLSARLRLVNDDEIVGISSRKGSSDFSCASSMTDEEGITLRAPGVVARLMGLDSMPTAGAFEPNSTPFFDSRSLRDKQSHKRSPEIYMNDQFDHVVRRVDGYANRPMERRSQKMPSSPIERFQTETLPPKSARSLPITHHKLLSPIKNPGFIYAKHAAAPVMETAAKILDSRDQPSTRSSSIPLRVYGSKEIMVVSQSQRASRIPESARTPVDLNDFTHLKGKTSNRSWNGLEDDAVLRHSQGTGDGFSADMKGKGKSISLAIQAKVNVQRRESLNSSLRNSLVQKEHDVCSFNQASKSQPSNQKNKQPKKSKATYTSDVLRQNNQKQNCISSKGKLSLKQSLSNQQHGRKVLSVDSSSANNKSSNKICGNLKYAHAEKESSSSSSKGFPRKKRLIERSIMFDKMGFTDDVLEDRHQKRIQPNVVIDEHSCLRRKEDNRSDGADVVSFTFTSPLIKPISVSRFTTQVAENLDNGNMHDTRNQKKIYDANNRKLISHGLNLMSGDDLSLLLEQKLRGLTGGFQPSCGSILKSGSSAASSSISQEPLSDLDAIDNATVEHEELQHDSPRDRPDNVFGYGVSSANNGEMHGTINLQELEECSSSSDARREFDIKLASPFSIPEASLSNESSDRSDGSSSSIQAQCNASFNSASKTLSRETETEFSDTASSTITETSDELGLSDSNCIKACSHDFNDSNYVREILFDATLASEEDTLVNPVLFDKLEDRRRATDKDGSLKRKVLFDCVNECLDLKCSKWFRAGYRAWSKAELVLGKESLADEIHDEILKWKRMGDSTVDELVDKDMSSHLGKWLDYEIEAFEEGLQIEREIVDSLVEEVITDCLMKG